VNLRQSAESPAKTSPPPRAATLSQLSNDLQPLLIEVVTAPAEGEQPITGIELHGLEDHITAVDAADKLILIVDSASREAALRGFVEAATAAQAGALALRNTAWPSELVELARDAGLTLITIPTDLAWGELYELLRAAIAADGIDRPAHEIDDEWRGLDDLFSLAEAIAAMAGGPVTIDDMQSRILAFSGSDDIDEGRRATILNRKVPERWLRVMRERGMIEHLLTSDEVLHVSFDEIEPRRAVAIRLGKSVLGSIWLAGSDEDLSPDADEALRRAAPIAALQMMRQRVGVSLERRTREARVAALLDEDECSAWAIEQVGLRANRPLVMLAAEGMVEGAAAPLPAPARLIDLLSLHLQGYEQPIAFAASDTVVYGLANCGGPDSRAALRRAVAPCITHAARVLGVELRVGFGLETDPRSIGSARRSAEDSLDLGPGDAGIVDFDEVRTKALLTDVAEFVGDWRGGSSPTIELLIEHDESHGTEYFATLHAVLQAFGSLTQAAKLLHVHLNTVRYRIARISEVAKVDLDDAEARLALDLELRALTQREDESTGKRRQDGRRAP
jgi:sugar diacid utilization regulator